jgi:polyprenyl-phospho-N-acetylgalactosaminyl synthase
MLNRQTYVVVPSFNEGAVVEHTAAELLRRGYTVVVVDDGSHDNSWDILRTLPIIRLRHMLNLGQGAALQTGMTYALRCGAHVVVHFDADGQHDADEIPQFVDAIETKGFDVALGSRFLRDSDRQEIPGFRRVLLKIGRLVSGLLTGVWLSDAHNGFRAFSYKGASAIEITQNGFAHATEILEQIRKARLRYTEVPTRVRYTKYSLAKGQRSSNSLIIMVDLLLRKIYP